jgi:hypothetical protein
LAAWTLDDYFGTVSEASVRLGTALCQYAMRCGYDAPRQRYHQSLDADAPGMFSLGFVSVGEQRVSGVAPLSRTTYC